MAVGLSGCVTRVADLTIASPQDLSHDFKELKDVEGRSCAAFYLFIPTGNTTPSLDATIDDALAQAAGADALVDATFYWEQLFTLFYNRVCLRVEATAISTE